MIRSVYMLVLLLLFYFSGNSQEARDAFFKKGDKISFIGNSITHGGDFHHYILMYYATRYPNARVDIYNVGIKGDNANNFLQRMESDILSRKADWSVVMAGMNDINRALYDPQKQSEPGIEERKKRALDDYRNYYSLVLQKLKKSKTKIIIQKPSIYDETGDLPGPNMPGANNALNQCNQIIDELAKKYKVDKVVDYWTIMNTINRQVQEKDQKATIVSNDRIHPGSVGHMIMAYQFLKSTDARPLVSSIVIDGGNLKDNKYCKVEDLKTGGGEISFRVKEESLPLPVPAEAKNALTLVPFTQDFNRQMLQVSSLPAGTYTLSIDGQFISNFSSDELSKGVNLALLENTPQYRQSIRVLGEAIKFRNAQRRMRDIKFTEFRYFPESLWNGDTNAIKKFIDNYLTFQKTANNPRYEIFEKLFNDYLQLKPQQSVLQQQIDTLPTSVYAAAETEEHHYHLAKADLTMQFPASMPFGTNLAGAEFAHDKIPGIYNKNYTYPTVAELDYFKSKGFTLFRLPFLWERLQHEPGGPLDSLELSRIADFVDRAGERKLWVILDMHNYGRRYVKGVRHIIGEEGLTAAHAADAWRRIAQALKTKQNIMAYDIMNEPHDMNPKTSWFSIAQEVVNGIRDVDSHTPIMVEGDSWASAARWMEFSDSLKYLKDPANKLMFEAHIYFDEDASGTYKRSYDEEQTTPMTGVERARPFVEWLKKNNFKGIIGEYGVPDDDPRWLVTLDNMLAYLEENGVGGTYWAAGPWWNKYRLAIEPRNNEDRPQMKVLMKYTRPSNPVGTGKK